MADGSADTVLERKAQAQRQALGVGTISISRALGRSLSIAADALWALGLASRVFKDEILGMDRALNRVSEDQLLVILEKDGSPCALASFDRALVTGLIEVQTLGKITRMPLDDRPYTQTDAAMMAPLVDAALPRFASMLAGQPDLVHVHGYGFGALVDDIQTAGLVLDAQAFHTISLELSLAQDTRAGRAVFLFPQHDIAKGKDAAGAGNKGKHEAVMKLVPARMQAVLTRIHVPLSKAQALKPGDVLDISSEAINAVTLVVEGGHVAAKGKLGQMNGLRAVRIGEGPALLHAPNPPEGSSTQPAVATATPSQTSVTAQVPPDSISSIGMDFGDLPSGLVDPADLL